MKMDYIAFMNAPPPLDTQCDVLEINSNALDKIAQQLLAYRAALATTLAKIEKTFAHPPLTVAQARAKHITLPTHYDRSEALFHWAHDTLGNLYDLSDKQVAMIAALERQHETTRQRLAALHTDMIANTAHGHLTHEPLELESSNHYKKKKKKEEKESERKGEQKFLQLRTRLLRRFQRLRRNGNVNELRSPYSVEHSPPAMALKNTEMLCPIQYVTGVQILSPGVIIVNQMDIPQ